MLRHSQRKKETDKMVPRLKAKVGVQQYPQVTAGSFVASYYQNCRKFLLSFSSVSYFSIDTNLLNFIRILKKQHLPPPQL